MLHSKRKKKEKKKKEKESCPVLLILGYSKQFSINLKAVFVSKQQKTTLFYIIVFFLILQLDVLMVKSKP